MPNAIAEIRAFYDAVDRDLIVYMAVLAISAAAVWAAAIATRGRGVLVAAVTLFVLGGLLAGAAQWYRTTLPERAAADGATLEADPAAAVGGFAARYEYGAATSRFRVLAYAWSGLAAAAVLVAALVRTPAVAGGAAAIVFLCAASLVLDYGAWRRDLAYADAWTRIRDAGE
jgi:hypothetical protein